MGRLKNPWFFGREQILTATSAEVIDVFTFR
jgi:hypothetical protein